MKAWLMPLLFWVLAGGAAAADIVAKLPSYPDGAGGSREWQLVDSRYGYVAPYSLALANALDACGKEASVAALLRIAPHRVTRATVDALSQLETCGPDAAGNLFQRFAMLDAGRPPPTVFERARMLALRASPLTPDYDRSFWDAKGERDRRSADPDSLFTWGPWRATAGQGCTLQSVLKGIAADSQAGGLLRALFQDEQALLDGLLGQAGCTHAKALLQPLLQEQQRADAFQFALARLADEPRVREIHDQAFYGRGGFRLGFVEDYVRVWQAAGRGTVTEIDIAFFLERSLQYGRLKPEQVKSFIDAAPGASAPWELRRLASRIFNFTAGAARQYQTGRDVTYYIDGAQTALDQAELKAWVAHSRVRASDAGLQDRPVDVCRVFPLRRCPEASP